MSIENKVVVFTGKISKPRHEFEDLVLSNGGVFGTSVTKNTDYLIVGTDPGSKLATATMLGTTILSEEEFLKLLEEDLDEEPTSEEELIELQSHIVTLTCRWCEKEYQQWGNLPNYKTCPVCEIKARPVCPHCGGQPIFITAFVNYYCRTCNKFFEGPHSESVYCQDHIHVSKEGSTRCMICGNTLDTPIKTYPGKVLCNLQELRKEEEKHRMFQAEEDTRKERSYDKWASSLTREDIEELKKRIA